MLPLPRSSRRSLRRHRLLLTTALQAAAIGGAAIAGGAMPARAQLSPNARPSGGQVVAGSASISTTASATNIDQSSQRAAVNWQSFDVGSAQSVNFHQPSPSAVILNRVAGPDPSVVAGRINANGQVIITNPSGVVFSKGSEVNAAGLVVSAAGISNANLMAGRMVFDQAPNPNARISNDGTITVRDTGLAAMVAPSVANRGVITAKLGRVVLAGAVTHTLDLYGDGLVSIDVGGQVRQVPRGRDNKPVEALVTNTGTIIADGGQVQLTAQAADGVVQTLVDAGGTVRANTLQGGNGTAHPGAIAINGTGGAVVIEGAVQADGDPRAGAGGSGGDGGTVAIGTILARARGQGAAGGAGTFPAGTTPEVVVTPRARITANASGRGRGGRVTLLSGKQTVIAGTIEARGGSFGGDGGDIELSGAQGFALSGSADVTAAHGRMGTIVLDPANLDIVGTASTGTATPPYTFDATPGTADVTAAAIEALSGNIDLQASTDLSLQTLLNLPGRVVTLEAGRNLTVTSAGTLVAGSATLTAAAAASPSFDATGGLDILGAVNADSIQLNAGSGGIVLAGTLGGAAGGTAAAALLGIQSAGPFVEQGGTAAVFAGELYGTADAVSLLSPLNQIGAVGGTLDPGGGGLVATDGTAGGVAIADATPLVVGGTDGVGIRVNYGQTITLIDDSLVLAPGVEGGNLYAPGGLVTIAPLTSGRNITVVGDNSTGSGLVLTTDGLAGVLADTLQLGTFDASGRATAGNIAFLGTVAFGGGEGGIETLALAASGLVSQTGPLSVGAITGQAGTLALNNPGNAISTLLGFRTTAGTLALATGNELEVVGTVAAAGGGADVSLSSNGSDPEDGSSGLFLSGTLQGRTVSLVAAGTGDAGGGDIFQSAGAIQAATLVGSAGTVTLGGTNAIGTLGDFQAAQVLDLDDTVPLTLAGAIGAGSAELDAPGITQSGGALSIGVLNGSSSGNVRLGGANTISAIGSFALTGAGGTLLVADAVGTLGIGTVTGTGAAMVFAADAVQFDGGTATAIADLGGSVGFTPYTAGNAITVTDGAATASGLVLTTAELARVQADTLQLGTPGTNGTPGAGNIAFLGTVDLNGFGTLALAASGAVSQSGALSVPVLAGQAGTLSLSGADNDVPTLGGFSTTAGTLALTTGGGLTVAGDVVAQGGTGSISLVAEGVGENRSGLVLTGNIDGGSVSLVNSAVVEGPYGGSVIQTGGTISAGTLTGRATTTLLDDANAIGTLGDFGTGGSEVDNANVSIRDVVPLTLDGTISVQDALTLVAPAITQSGGSVTAAELDGSSGGDVRLGAGNAIGAIGSFSMTGTGSTLLLANAVGTLGIGTVTGTGSTLVFEADAVQPGSPLSGITATAISDPGGTVAFAPYTAGRGAELIAGNTADPDTLALTGSLLSGITADVLALGNAETGPITIGQDGDAIGLRGIVGTLLLGNAGTVVSEGQAAGLSVGTLAGNVGTITLGGTGNLIDALGSLTTGGLTLVDGQGLTIAGPVLLGTGTGSITAAGTITVSGVLTEAASAPGLTLDASAGDIVQTAGLIGASALALDTVGSVTQSGGSIVADTLDAGATGTISLPSGGNDIGTLGAVRAAGLDIAEAGNLVLDQVQVNGTAAFALGGSLVGGDLAASTLSGSAAAVFLGSADQFGTAASQVGTIAGFTSPGSFVFFDGGQDGFSASLTLAGTISSGTGITVSDVGPVTLSGSVSAPSVAITANNTDNPSADFPVSPNGVLTQTGGTVSGGTVTLQAGNGFTQQGGLVEATGSAGSASITVGGTLSLGGTVSAPALRLDAASASYQEDPGNTLSVLGTVLQTGGALLVGTLNGSASTGIALTAAGNSVSALGDIASQDGFRLVDAAPTLSVAGAVGDDTSLELDANAITIAGSLSSPQLILRATGTVAENGGVIGGETLTGSAAALTLLSAGNSLDVLGSFASGAELLLADADPLTVAGPASVGTGGTILVRDDALGFGAGGTLAAPGGTVALAPYTLADGLTVGGTGQIPQQPSVVADILVVGDAAGGPIDVIGTFAPTAVSVLELLSAGAVAEGTAGALQVPTLSGRAASFVLDGANTIGTLGNLDSSGGIDLVNGNVLADDPLLIAGSVTAGSSLAITSIGPLSVSGTVSAPVVSLQAEGVDVLSGLGSGPVDGTITQTGGLISGGSVSLTALDEISQSGGSIIATGIGGTVALAGSGTLSLGGTIAAAALDLVAASRTVSLGEGTSDVTAGAIAQSGGALLVGTLDGSASGGIALAAAGNSVSALGDLSSQDGFRLVDAAPILTVAGTVGDNTSLELDADAIILAGTLLSPQLILRANGAVTETTGVIGGETLSGSAADLSLLGAGNSLDALGPFASTGDLRLADADPLTVQGLANVAAGGTILIRDDALGFGTGGTLAAPGGTVALAPYTLADGITLGGTGQLASGSPVLADTLVVGDTAGGPVSVIGGLALANVPVLDLLSAGAVTEGPAGALQVATLSGRAASFTLDGANQIGTLDGLSSGGSIALANGANGLVIAGAVGAGSGIVIESAGPITVSGTLSGGTSVLLRANGTVDPETGQQDGGTITQTGGTVVGGSVSLSAADEITQQAGLIEATAPGGTVELSGSGTLSLGGTIAAPTLDLVAASRTASTENGGSVVVPGAVVQDGGQLAVGTLIGAADGGISLTQGGNTIDTLGTLNSGGNLFLADAGNLLIAGAVSAAGTLALLGGGTVAEAGGSITAGMLSGTAAAFALDGGADAIGTLGNVFGTDGFALSDTRPLSVAGNIGVGTGGTLRIADDSLDFVGGTLSAPVGVVALGELTPGAGLVLTGALPVATAGTVVLGSTTGGALVIAGSLDLDAVPTVQLLSAAGISESDGGALSVATLTGSGASIALDGANRIGTLGALNSGGNLSLVDEQDLSLAGTVTAKGTLALAVAGSIDQLSGAVAASVLTGTATGVDLSAGGNAVGTLGGFSSENGFALADTGMLAVSGPVVDPVRIALQGSDGLSIAGTITTGFLTLSSGGAIVENAAGALAATILGGAGARVDLGGGANRIGTLGALAGGTELSLSDEQDLSVAGMVTAGTLDLLVSGALGETANGGISASVLTGSATALDLGGGGDAIAILGSFTTANGFVLADAGTLTVSGPVSDPTRVTLGADALALDGTVTTGLLALDVAGAVTEGADGVLAAGTLAGSAGSIALDGANRINTLGTLASGANLELADAVPLTVAGPASAATGGTLAIADDALEFGGGTLSAPGGVVALAERTPGAGLTLGTGNEIAGALSVSAGTLVLGSATGGALVIGGSLDLAEVPTVALLSAGSISESGGGALTLGTLAGSGSAIVLGGANRIAALGALSSGGDLLLADGRDLSIAGPVSAGGTLALSVAGSVTEASGGSVGASVLTGTATALGLGGSGNAIDTLGPFSTGGSFALSDGRDLLVTGPVDPTAVTMTVDGALGIDGAITGDTVSLAATGAITEGAAGVIRAGVLSASGTSVALGNGTNAVGTLDGGQAAGGFLLADGADLALDGGISAGSLRLLSTGGIAQEGGTIVAGTLSGVAGGAAAFGTGTAASSIGTLGDFAVGTTLTLFDDAPLVLAGTLSAPQLAVSAVGSMVVDGGAIATTGLPVAQQEGPDPAAPGSFLSVLPDPATGLGRFTQFGMTTVSPFDGAASTLRINLPAAGGTLSLADLEAPNTTIILGPGRGTATGTLDAGGLLALDQGGSATLFGRVAALDGDAAATASQITPQSDAAFQLNGCVIAADCAAPTLPATEPPASEPPATEPPASEPPATEPPATEPPATEPPDTEAIVQALLASDPVAYSILRPDIQQDSLVDAQFLVDPGAGRHRTAARTPLLSFSVMDAPVSRDPDDETIELPNISDRDY